jgi:hypothetical protein
VLQRVFVTGLIVAAAGVGIGWGGGFDAAPQWLFGGLAVAAGLVAWRRPSAPAAVLVGLAVLGALSASWTIGSSSGALRWGLVIAGYAALAIAGSALPGRVAAAGIALAAGATALTGLVGAALYLPSLAERIEGGWRPEGPLGYPPALALLQVFALPIVLAAMARGGRVAAPAAAVGAALAAGTIALAQSRSAVALAALVVALAVLDPARTVGASRRLAVAACLLMAAAGLAVHAAAGGWVSRFAQPDGWRLAAALLACATAAPVWLAVRRLAGEGFARPLALPGVLAGGAVVAVAAVAVGLGTASPLSARRFASHQGLSHGRTWMWRAAADTAFERPASGYGADTFLAATYSRQPGQGRLTRFAHNLPLELFVELGVVGIALALALYWTVGRVLWQARGSPALWLLGPAAAAFLLSNLVDWTWHLAGVGALFAVAVGGLVRVAAKLQIRHEPVSHASQIPG